MSDCATWWFDHVGATYFYVVAVREGDERRQADEVEKLLDGAAEWERLTAIKGSGALMAEHVAQVKVLVDAAFIGDSGTVETAVDVLLANVEAQTALYVSSVPEFPEEEWRKLFTSHVSSTGAYVLALAAGDAEDFKRNFGLVVLGRNALARLWGLLCARKRSTR